MQPAAWPVLMREEHKSAAGSPGPAGCEPFVAYVVDSSGPLSYVSEYRDAALRDHQPFVQNERAVTRRQ